MGYGGVAAGHTLPEREPAGIASALLGQTRRHVAVAPSGLLAFVPSRWAVGPACGRSRLVAVVVAAPGVALVTIVVFVVMLVFVLGAVLAGGIAPTVPVAPTLALSESRGGQKREAHAQCQNLQKTLDRKSTRLNSSHIQKSRMPSSA